MKVALFTSFRPDTGGGAAVLRSLLGQATNLDVTWFHLGPASAVRQQSIAVGPSLIGGRLVTDVIRTPVLWLGTWRGAIQRIADRISAARCERHWVVAMDEGIPVGLRLAQLRPDVPLHVTIHDDQERGMYGRSRRYRLIARLTRGPFRRLLRAARAVDVISDEMGAYYREQIGLDAAIIHPFVAESTPSRGALSAVREPRRLKIGHIGSIYSPREFQLMLGAFKSAAAALGREPAGCFVGLLPRYRPLVEQAGIAAEMPDHLDEPDAIVALARCDFVYGMYPFDRASEVFVRTSLPTKLTTYVQAGRPILAHAPAESTLARTVMRFGIGVVCAQNTADALELGVKSAAALACGPERFRALRDAYYGADNVRTLSALLQHGRNS